MSWKEVKENSLDSTAPNNNKEDDDDVDQDEDLDEALGIGYRIGV